MCFRMVDSSMVVDQGFAQAALVIHADFKRVLLETLVDGGRWNEDCNRFTTLPYRI